MAAMPAGQGKWQTFADQSSCGAGLPAVAGFSPAPPSGALRNARVTPGGLFPDFSHGPRSCLPGQFHPVGSMPSGHVDGPAATADPSRSSTLKG